MFYKLKIKYLILTTFLTLLSNSQQRTFDEFKQIWHANVLKHNDKCLKESGADPNLATRVIRYAEFVDDRKVMCFIRCISDNLQVVHLDNSIHHENFLDVIDVHQPKLLKKANFIEKCYDIKLADECESIYRIAECIYRSIEGALSDVEPKA